MKGRGGHNEIDRGLGETGVFSGPFGEVEFRISRCEVARDGAHVRIRLDGVNFIPVAKEEFRRDACAGADVGDNGFRAPVGVLFENGDDGVRIARPLTRVVSSAAGEAVHGSGSIVFGAASRQDDPSIRNDR